MSAEDIIPDITAMPLKDSSDNRLILFKLIPPAKNKAIKSFPCLFPKDIYQPSHIVFNYGTINSQYSRQWSEISVMNLFSLTLSFIYLIHPSSFTSNDPDLK